MVTGRSVVLTSKFGSFVGPRRPWTPVRPATLRSGWSSSRSSPRPRRVNQRPSVGPSSPRRTANSLKLVLTSAAGRCVKSDAAITYSAPRGRSRSATALAASARARSTAVRGPRPIQPAARALAVGGRFERDAEHVRAIRLGADVREDVRRKEDAGEPVIVRRADRIELVIMTPGAGDRQAEKRLANDIDLVIRNVGEQFLLVRVAAAPVAESE